MKYKKMTITPPQAKEWLKKNRYNRNIKWATVHKYARDMKDGRWRFNPLINIAFTEDGILIDGQHRLLACVEANVSFVSIVVFGASLVDQQTVDHGNSRSASDDLEILKVKHAVRIAAAARLILIYNKGGINSINGANEPTKTEVLEFCLANKDELAKRIVGEQSLCMPRVPDFCNFVFSRIDEELAKNFMDSLRTGSMLANTSPVYVLRERLLKLKQSREKMPLRGLIALFFVSWNHYRKGNEIKMLKIPTTFPTIE